MLGWSVELSVGEHQALAHLVESRSLQAARSQREQERSEQNLLKLLFPKLLVRWVSSLLQGKNGQSTEKGPFTTADWTPFCIEGNASSGERVVFPYIYIQLYKSKRE